MGELVLYGFAPGWGDLYVGILEGLGGCPRFVNKNKKEVAMEIEFYFRFKLKPKTKKVTVVVDEQ